MEEMSKRRITVPEGFQVSDCSGLAHRHTPLSCLMTRPPASYPPMNRASPAESYASATAALGPPDFISCSDMLVHEGAARGLVQRLTPVPLVPAYRTSRFESYASASTPVPLKSPVVLN